MEIEQPLSIPQMLRRSEDNNALASDTDSGDGSVKPPLLGDSGRSKSDNTALMGMIDDSPPRLDDRRNGQILRKEYPILSLESTNDLISTKLDDARRDTHNLTGSEEVSEVVKPKLTLDLGSQNISRLSDSSVDLMKGDVERLSLAHNKLWHLPTRFSECKHLRYLSIRSNAFRDFPDGLYELNFLEILDISRNRLKRIPSRIAEMTSLRVCSIVHNKVTDLPPELCTMNKLQILKVAENPLSERLRKVIRFREREGGFSDMPGNEQEQAVTAEIKRYLRDFRSVPTAHENEAPLSMDEAGPDSTPKPIKRVVSSRFPVVPTAASIDAGADGARSSPHQAPNGWIPPIPSKSHYRGVSGQSTGPRRVAPAPTLQSNERNRSNSEGLSSVVSANSRPRRIGLLQKSRVDELDAIDESKLHRQSHLRGFSHGSVLRRNGSISSSFAGSESPGSPYDARHHRMAMVKRLSSLPEGKADTDSASPIIDGAKGLLYALHQIESQVRGLISVVERSDARRSSLEFTYYNASKWLKRLNSTLEQASSVDPEDNEQVEKAQDSVQQNCADCIMAYKHVISQLQENARKIVTGIDARYVRTLMLLLFGSIVEIRNAMKSFGLELKGHRKQLSSGNTYPIQTIPEEFTTPEQQIRTHTPLRGRSTTRPQTSRLRGEGTLAQANSETTAPNGHLVQPSQHPMTTRMMASYPPNYGTNGGTFSSASSFTSGRDGSSTGFRSRSNSRTNFTNTSTSSFSAIANPPRSAEAFGLVPSSRMVMHVNPVADVTDMQEEQCFEAIYLALTRSYEHALQAIPIAKQQFQRCLDAAEASRQPKSVCGLWQTLVYRCKNCHDLSEALQMRLANMSQVDTGYNGTNATGGRNDPSLWLLCKTFLQSFIDLVTEMREAKELRLLPPEILIVLRPVQKASKNAGKLINASPWQSLFDGTTALPPQTAFAPVTTSMYNNIGYTVPTNGVHYSSNLVEQHAPQTMQILPTPMPPSGLPTPLSATSAPASFHPHLNGLKGSDGLSGSSPNIQFPATPLSAALGPAAQATVPSTPASAYGDQFFKGDVFQRADSLLSMPQAGSVNFLNRR